VSEDTNNASSYHQQKQMNPNVQLELISGYYNVILLLYTYIVLRVISSKMGHLGLGVPAPLEFRANDCKGLQTVVITA